MKVAIFGRFLRIERGAFTGTIDKVTLAVTPPPASVGEEEDRAEAVLEEGIN